MTKDDDLIVHVMLPNLVLNPGRMKTGLDSARVRSQNSWMKFARGVAHAATFARRDPLERRDNPYAVNDRRSRGTGNPFDDENHE